MSSPPYNPALVGLRQQQGEERRAPLTVSQLTTQLRQMLEQRYARVTVVGELSNVKVHGSGHCYMCLKDQRAQLQAVMWRREHAACKVRLTDGMQVVASGRLTVYEQAGRYQLAVDRIELVGAGALQAAFEQTKARLLAEGLFAAERKRKLQLVPRTVAVVTSPTGAVIRDIVNVATRRFPRARIVVFPAKVQGAESATWIAAAVKRASRLAPVLDLSVIIVARGGGSLEDLWGFNDERVARAIAGATIPVVSGVGHETDTTIADFVADLRAPTPSAAAELVFPVASLLGDRLAKPVARMRRALRRDLERERRRMNAARRVLGDGRSLLQEPARRLDAAHGRVVAAARACYRDQRLALQRLEARIGRAHPRVQLTATRAALAGAQSRLASVTRARVEAQRARLAEVAARLHALSPLAVLDRGFALVRSQDGMVVRSAADVAVGSHVDIRVARGQIQARIERVTPPADEDR